jgi:hypothetical protein
MKTFFRISFLILCLFPALSNAQYRITTAGFQFKPIFSSKFFTTGPVEANDEGINFSTAQKSGYCFGMVIRHGITERISFETGINYVRRNFKLTITDDKPLINSEYRIISYEIPVQGMVYIQLFEKVFMNTAFGISFDMFPTDVQTFSKEFDNYGARRAWVANSLIANLGYEFRTEKSGFFYLGASYHRPFKYIYTAQLEYTGNNNSAKAESKLSGNYLTVDLRYFFHADPEKRKKKTKK